MPDEVGTCISDSMTTKLSQPISERTTPWGCLFVFFGIFGAAGSALIALLFIPAVYHIWQARNWVATPCIIMSSRVSGSGKSFKVEVDYRYIFHGLAYRSKRYQFLDASSSFSAGKYAIVHRLPRLSKATCYVDPVHPDQAVIERSLTGEVALSFFVPCIFVAVGVGGMVMVWRGASRKRPAVVPAAVDAAALREQALMLKPRYGPFAKLVGIILLAAFWNGIVSVFVYQAIKGWNTGGFSIFMAVFLTPFVLAGLVLVFAVFQAFLALFNPRPRLQIDTGQLTLGSAVDLRWWIDGR